MLFNIGDRVKIKFNGNYKDIYGYTGTIKVIKSSLIGIQFDSQYSNSLFHSCLGFCELNKGLWLNFSDLELLEPAKKLSKQEIIINKIKYLEQKFKDRNQYV